MPNGNPSLNVLNSPTALLELKTHLPFEFVQVATDALQRAGLD
jgi:hypothetical protein